MDRFYFDNIKIDYYWCIRDSEDTDGSIWIDCPIDYIPIILEALNANLKKDDGYECPNIDGNCPICNARKN